MLNAPEDAHVSDVSIFEENEHLRGNGAAALEYDGGLEIPKFLDRRGIGL